MAHSSILNRYLLGDMEVAYLRDRDGHVGLRLLPSRMPDVTPDSAEFSEPLVQIHIRGDFLAGAAATEIEEVICSEGNCVSLADGFVEVELKANFEGIALALKRVNT